jgi:transposase InsO family protein
MDNGSGYRGGVFGAMCEQLGLRHHWTQPYRPQTNGTAERFIRTCLAEWASQRSYPRRSPGRARSETFCDTTTSTDSTWGSTGSLPCSDLLSIGEQRLNHLQLGRQPAGWSASYRSPVAARRAWAK